MNLIKLRILLKMKNILIFPSKANLFTSKEIFFKHGTVGIGIYTVKIFLNRISVI